MFYSPTIAIFRSFAPFLQAFGVDDGRIIPIIATIGAAFAFLFSTWSNKQDNDEFFSTYQKTERK